jgi:beta-lactam-binding protein with PASTA domain
MRHFFNLVLGAMAMVTVALISAFLAMRLAIHGREVKVPNLAHMTIVEASQQAASMGLQLRLENRFYSPDTPSGQVLAQFPAAGTIVRRQWPVRVTESLGAQQVSIPDLKGQGERAASIHLRRLGLELGAVGSIAAPGSPGLVVAQTPAANAVGVDSPRVSVLMSESAAENDTEEAYVMPSLVGLSLSSAFARVNAAGLRIVSAEDVTPLAAAPSPEANGGSHTSVPSTANMGAMATTAPAAGGIAVPSTDTVVEQTPPAGHRVVRGDAVRISLIHIAAQ